MKSLQLIPINAEDRLIKPEEFSEITMQSSALTIFDDGKEHPSVSVDHKLSAKEALLIMRKAHVTVILVTDISGVFCGAISQDDISEQAIILRVAQGTRRDDITVGELMTPREDIVAIDYNELALASVAEVIETLQQNSKNYCLVIDLHNHHIRGIISIADISRRLHTSLETHTQNTLINIFKTVRQQTI